MKKEHLIQGSLWLLTVAIMAVSAWAFWNSMSITVKLKAVDNTSVSTPYQAPAEVIHDPRVCLTADECR